jgi:nonsense-mediated mRNA decay protein 3
MCVNCIRSQVDITEGIPKQLTVQWCKNCERFLEPPNRWLICPPESKELLAFCLRRVRGLNKVRLVDASFVWTEPHSRRLKVKLDVQKEVFTATILQQSFIIEYVIQNFYCPDCHKLQADDTWTAVAQVRQHVEHKRTFYWLEQMILKHNAHQHCTNVKEVPQGLDFYFAHVNHCMKFIDFLQAVVPIRCKSSKKLISHDEHSNVYNYKHTFSVEIVPICRNWTDDIVCLPSKVARSLGNISPIVLCVKVSNLLHFIDPLTLQQSELSSNLYWQTPFRALLNRTGLSEYFIIDVEPVTTSGRSYYRQQRQLLPPSQTKWQLVDVTVTRVTDRSTGRLDSSGVQYVTRSHLGHYLKPGDTVLGYHLANGNFNDADLAGLTSQHRHQMPEIVLVRKSYPVTRRRLKARHWKLKELAKEEDESITHNKKDSSHRVDRSQDYEMFLRDLEEDPELRAQINLYKVPDAEKILQARRQQRDNETDTKMTDADESAEDLEEDFPEVQLNELIDEMQNMQLEDESVAPSATPTAAITTNSNSNSNSNSNIQQRYNTLNSSQ